MNYYILVLLLSSERSHSGGQL